MSCSELEARIIEIQTGYFEIHAAYSELCWSYSGVQLRSLAVQLSSKKYRQGISTYEKASREVEATTVEHNERSDQSDEMCGIASPQMAAWGGSTATSLEAA